MIEFERAHQDLGRINFSGSTERSKFQPYRADLQLYLSSHHNRLVPQTNPHEEAHSIVERVEKNAALFLNSSDIAAGQVSSPEFQNLAQRQKKELRGQCSIGLFICIDGRLVPIIVGSPVFDISESKAGLVPIQESPIDGELELANPRIIESVIDRPTKESPEILQISSGHEDSSKADTVTCAAVLQMMDSGLLPKDESYKVKFREMMLKTGVAVGATFNRSARARGYHELQNVGLTATYDTRTAGFTLDGDKITLNTTRLTKEILRNDDLATIQRLSQHGMYRQNFTEHGTLLSRENSMYNIEKVLLRQSKVFDLYVDEYIKDCMGGYTDRQKQALRFFVARTIANQITSGLYQGGDHVLSSHNEQYISTSTNGLRIGQFDPHIQSFGANVANYKDSVSHLETKVALADQIGKMPAPYVAFLSESEPEKTSPSTDRNTRAKLRSHMLAVMESPQLLQRIKTGELWLIPVVLQEKTGIVKGIPNLAI